jgi:hypothetical protein
MSRTSKIIHAARPRAEGEPSYYQVHRRNRKLLGPVECAHCGATTRLHLHVALRHDADPDS